MRAVALLGLHVKERDVRRFELPGVDVFSGNELEPTDQPDAALIFGGDGTVHRHLAGLALKQIPTLVVPVGSGNDFAQSIDIDNVATALKAWQRFCASGDNVRAIDLGTIQPLEDATERDANQSDPMIGEANAAAVPWHDESLENMHFVPDGPRRELTQMGPRIMQSQLRRATEAEDEIARTTVFSCIAGTGLDAAVNRLALKQSRWLRGHGGYVIALMRTLGSFQPPHIKVSVESGGVWRTAMDERGFLIAAGNGPQYGHGMRLAHRAQMDDGLLDLCFVRLLSKMRLLRLFRVVYRGRHLGMKEVEYFQAARLRIATDPVSEVFADGEYICRTPVEIGVRTKALRVIVSLPG
ncbi:MAG: diacylglycerol kinase family protein [Candidatus Korobacteraceae bacterium]